MGSAVLTNALVTAIDATKPDVNLDYQTRSTIRMSNSPSPGEISWLMYFARPFPLRATIVSARIVMYSAASSQTGAMTLVSRRVKQAISFTKATFNTRPTSFYSVNASGSRTGPVADKSEWSIDVTAQMQSVSLGDPWYGFYISSGNINPYLIFYGPTWSDPTLRPRLEVTWADEPDQPRTLAPSGGRAVSVAKPIVRCDYVDVSGDTDMASIQVQINSTSSFTSPAFDSGTVASTTPELDLSLTAYAGLADGSTAWWRVRVQDGAGLWSDWSVPVSFVRDSKGALTVTAPSSGTPVVEDATPPISWTFTGETQAAYQVSVTETTADGGQRLWTSGKKTGTITTYTLPSGVITSPDSSYLLSVRIWDTKQRESTPGDPAYVEVTRTFTYTPTAAVTATTSPTAVTAAPYPRVTVGWQRTTDPDSFTILRNRVVVASGLLAADVRVSGQVFSWVDRSAPPMQALTYEVLAVVNGRASASNPTVQATMIPMGIWLADATRANEVMIVGRDDRQLAYGEDSEAITVVGATETVIVTQGMRGYEGTITGELQSNMPGTGGITAQQWRAALLRIKRQAGRKCWLTFGDRTIECRVRNLTVRPKPTPPLAFLVSFEVYQTGTLDYVPSL